MGDKQIEWYTVYDVRLGTFHDFSAVEFKEVKKFYKLFKKSTDYDHEGYYCPSGDELWVNARGDIYAWKTS